MKPNDGNQPISDLAVHVDVRSDILVWLALGEHLDVLQDVVQHVDALEFHGVDNLPPFDGLGALESVQG